MDLHSIWDQSKHWLLLGVFSLWEHWLAKTEKLAAGSTYELISWGFSKLFKKEVINMDEKKIDLGGLGELDIDFEGGKALVKVSVSKEVPDAALSAKASVEVALDASLLIDKIEAAVAKKFPGIPDALEKFGFAALKEAVSKL